LLLAQAKMKDKDLEEGTPDHPGEPLETAEVNGESSDAALGKCSTWRGRLSPATAGSTELLCKPRCARVSRAAAQPVAASERTDAELRSQTENLPTTGTVVLDVEQGGIEVPSFVGKTVRGAVEAAQDAGLNWKPWAAAWRGNSLPPAGTHVAAGAHVTVQFGR
jgi:hypothetical protein